MSWNKELLWSLLAVWLSSLGSAQIESGLVVISVCCAATLLSAGQGRGEMVGGWKLHLFWLEELLNLWC